MNSNSSSESTLDSIDVTVFEDFYHLDITLPFIPNPGHQKPSEVISGDSEFQEGNGSKLMECLSSEEKVICEDSPEEITIDDLSSTLPELLIPVEQTFSIFSSDLLSSQNPPAEQTFSLFSEDVPIPRTPSSVKDTLIDFSIAPESTPSKLPPSLLDVSPSKLTEIMESTKSPVKSANDGFALPSERSFSLFSANLRSKTPLVKRQPLISFSPAVVSQQSKPMPISIMVTFSPVKESNEMKENLTPESSPNRAETPTDMDKTLVLKQISARTNQSPLYTPVTAMVNRFRSLALETPLGPSNKNSPNKQGTPKLSKEPVNTPLTSVAGQHQSRLEKVKLVSPLLRSPKFRPVSTRLPFRSSSKVTNTNTKKSPTVSQYKANPPVNEGSRIPVLKLN